ncbi:MAG TPA: hypothetical protein VIF15_08575 [Polyangiaceae bacterium]|jgi:hypothetical protein
MRRGTLPLLGSVCAVAVAACSYDWATGSQGAADGGADGLPPLDASGDVGDDATADATLDADAAPGLDAPTDQGEAAPPDCNTLETNVRGARAAAIVCTPGPSACMTTVADECGCATTVGDSQSVQAQSFKNAVAQFVQAHCPKPPLCTTCATPQPGLCVVSDAGSTGYGCYQ